jgi:hypothetical protein
MPDDPFAKLGALDQKLFQQGPSENPATETVPAIPPPSRPPAAVKKKESKTTPPKASGSKHEDMYACIHAIMQDIVAELPDLQTPLKEPYSVRITDDDKRWLQNTTFSYNMELDKKFNQGIFVRVGLKLLKRAIQHDPKTIREILEELK